MINMCLVTLKVRQKKNIVLIYFDYAQDTNTAMECANENSYKIMFTIIQNGNRDFYQPHVLLWYQQEWVTMKIKQPVARGEKKKEKEVWQKSTAVVYKI